MGYRILAYGLTSGIHNSHPNAFKIRTTIVSGGGGGMGSRPNMSFGADIADAYAMYGQKGGLACWDTREPRVCTASDGQTFSWPGHGLVADHPIFVSGYPNAILYIHGPSITPDTFALSVYPYTAPGVVTPYYPGNAPYNWGSAVSLHITPYRHAALGGNPGGIIGDQAIAGAAIGLYFNDGYSPPRSRYRYGGCGQNALGCGGAGGALYGSGAGVAQIGGMSGNPGNHLQGEGGSGAGFMNPDGSYPINQWGPGGGAGGTEGVIESELKPQYYFHAGISGQGGNPGPGGFPGGYGSYPVIYVEEWFPDEVEE